jgi:hypothetical protein
VTGPDAPDSRVTGRDRDSVGRARNARPRDGLGRPLPRAAPGGDGVPRIPDDLVVTPAEAAALGGQLLDEGLPFHAHEVFEAAWKASQGRPERELWRGLAQIAVGLTHARRGNATGAVALLRRGAARVRDHAASAPAGELISPGYVAASADELAARIGQAGLAAIPEPDLRLSLRPGPAC